MAEILNLPQVQAERIRIGALDPITGVPLAGPHNLYVSGALVKFGWKFAYDTGAELKDTGANGALCAYYKAADTYKRGDVTIEMCEHDPYLEALLSGGTVLNVVAGGREGYAAPPLGEVQANRVSIEIWVKRIKNGELDVTSPYAWWAYPLITNLKPGDFTHENAFSHPTFTGEVYENPNWADGPGNDWPAASDRTYQWVPTATLPAITNSAALVAS